LTTLNAWGALAGLSQLGDMRTESVPVTSGLHDG
jgi:hypothetical protein